MEKVKIVRHSAQKSTRTPEKGDTDDMKKKFLLLLASSQLRERESKRFYIFMEVADNVG